MGGPGRASSTTGGARGRGLGRSFDKLLVGLTTSFFGDHVAIVGAMALVYGLSGGRGSSVAITLIGLTAPLLLFGPLGGALADRMSRRTLMIAVDGGRAVAALLMVVADDVWTVYVLVTVLGVGRALFTPAVRSFVPEIVPPDRLARANALYTTVFNASLFAGSAAGGVVVGAAGVDAAFAINAATFVVSAVAVWAIPAPAARAQPAARAGLGRDALDGLAVVWRTPRTRALTVTLVAVVLAGGVGNVALVALADRAFDAGARGYGLLYGSYGAGMLACGLLLGARSPRGPIDPWLARGVALMAAGLGLAGVAPALWVAAAGLLLDGVGNTLENTALVTIVQTSVPLEQQGRAFGGLFSFASAAEIPALAFGGALLDAYPVRAVYVAVFVVMCGATLVASAWVASPVARAARRASVEGER